MHRYISSLSIRLSGLAFATMFVCSCTTVFAQVQRTINAGSPGKAISPYILGNSTRLDVAQTAPAALSKIWELLYNNCARGIAGGLDADTYNWKDMSGQGVGHQGTPGTNIPTTLSWMRSVRDRNSLPLITANLRGTGSLSSSGYGTFRYTSNDVNMLKTLAADWVRYINFILPVYRQGSTLPASDQAIVDSINWYGKPKLLVPRSESATPKVTWWELGNEPEIGLPYSTPGAPIFAPTPADYSARYKQVSGAMLGVDPSLKLGPCITTASNNNAWLDAVLADPANKVDFISYHPYGPLYGYAQIYGDTAAIAESALRYVRQQQIDYYNGIIARINAKGRSINNIKLIASEWNASSWQWEASAQAARMSHALGTAETIFAFADLGLFAATYWSCPSYGSGTETPGFKLFKEMQKSIGDRLIDSFSDGGNIRIYTTWNSKTHELCIWGLNFSDSTDASARLSIGNLRGVDKVTRKRLAKLTGTTSLMDYQPDYSSATIDWTSSDITWATNPSDFAVALPKSTLTLLVFHQASSGISALKGKADGEMISIDSSLVTAVFKDYFYIESDDRSAGICVSMPGFFLGAKTRVSVTGVLETNSSGERQIAATGVF